MELGYKQLQAQQTSWIDLAIDGMHFFWIGAFMTVAVLFGADAYDGLMMLMGW